MSLFVRVDTGFYASRKTMRLRIKLGSDAYWIPPRLWAYAADHHPDGVLSDYNADELAMVLGYGGDAQAMLEALLQAGFLDENPLRIHDWHEHQRYHVNQATFKDRAKKAAEARWKKERAAKEEEIENEKRGEEIEKASIASSIASSNASSIKPAPALKLSTPEPELSEEEMAEEIYQLYPLKVGKPKAIAKIMGALKKRPSDFLREKTEAYAKAVHGTDINIPHPATWFFQERYNDDPKTWTAYAHNGTTHQNSPRKGNSVVAERNSRILGAARAADEFLAEGYEDAPPGC